MDHINQGQGSGSLVVEGNDKEQSPITLATKLRDALRPNSHLAKHVFLPPLDWQSIAIPFSSATAARGERQWFIVDRYICRGGRSLTDSNDDVRILAKKLGSINPWTFGLLNCKGVIKVIDRQRKEIQAFDFVFRVPGSLEVVQSLRQNLLAGEMHYSLSRRIHMAKELARSVSYVHNLNFVHKHICPETILLLEDLQSKPTTFLVGFDDFRTADGGTMLMGDAKWERNLYRHPDRQGIYPDKAYIMQHDVYSLGVCLLEIGIWESFVAYSSEPKPKPQYGGAYQKFITWLKSTEAIASPQNANSPAYQSVIAHKLKDYFVHLAKTQLPISMGDKYSAVVVTCLTCLDKANEDFGDESQISDQEGILVAVRFIETILLKLNEISV